jgi:hypothetical protein
MKFKYRLAIKPRRHYYGVGPMVYPSGGDYPDRHYIDLIKRCANKLTDEEIEFILHDQKYSGRYRCHAVHGFLVAGAGYSPLPRRLEPRSYAIDEIKLREFNIWRATRSDEICSKDPKALDPYLEQAIAKNADSLTEQEKHEILYHENGTPRRFVCDEIPHAEKIVPEELSILGTLSHPGFWFGVYLSCCEGFTRKKPSGDFPVNMEEVTDDREF